VRIALDERVSCRVIELATVSLDELGAEKVSCRKKRVTASVLEFIYTGT
jgi:hypothetical protein